MTELEARTLCIDLDRTLCESDGDYAEAKPIPGARDALLRLREAGWALVLHTARHFNHWKTTLDWLARYEMPYDQIVFGKPPARIYIDDRAIPYEGDWGRLCDRLEELARAEARPGEGASGSGAQAAKR